MAAILTTSLVLASCSSNEPNYVEQGYPTAPEQSQAEPAADTNAYTPIAQLADADWLAETSSTSDIPERALAAYAGAALRIADEQPECGIGWNTLAGIGRVESVHGAYGGARIDERGQVSPAIIGVPLDGSSGVAEIVDTDGGELDGDQEYDRAVGPMQFIPGTWQLEGRDGNLDGEADPHNIDDAVLTAASYLCGEERDVTTDNGWNSAVTTYNQSRSYAIDVAEYAGQVLVV
ncbi:lytic transglycosylase domain-containing protein [Corynebacterium lubricantis]|uniref:lytic transglycosylase domain-containing protein n=1 Tax=Corynebacterium lubricantis TaxID=541095 RepID=UPI000360E976|nr:lytic murein transglycosylase [Corynebacterium lubricantis]